MSKYHKDVSHIKTLDPYRLQELYQMHPCAEHVVKKLLVAGERSGGKTLDEDVADCIWTLQRWQEMRAEDAQQKFDLIETTHAGSAEPTFEKVPKSTRYAWDILPNKASWAATDSIGTMYWYTHKPVRYDKNWRLSSGKDGLFYCGESCADWRDSLEARPQ